MKEELTEGDLTTVQICSADSQTTGMVIVNNNYEFWLPTCRVW
jgi:hypothetical protein